MLMLYLGLLDGYLKLESGSGYVTLVRDILLFAIVVGLLVRSQVDGRRLSLTAALGLGYRLRRVRPGADRQSPRRHAWPFACGLRPHLEFVPLFFLGYRPSRCCAPLSVCAYVTLPSVANGIVGYVQFHLTPAQLASWGPGYAQRVIGTGAFQRAAVRSSMRPARAPAPLRARLRRRLRGALWRPRAWRRLCPRLAGRVAQVPRDRGPFRRRRGHRDHHLRRARRHRCGGRNRIGLRRPDCDQSASHRQHRGTRRSRRSAADLVVTSILSSSGNDAFRYQGLSASKVLATTAGGRPAQLGRR